MLPGTCGSKTISDAGRRLLAPPARVCAGVLETDEGLLTHEELARKKHTCPLV